MKKTSSFIKTSLLGGFIVLLPISILIAVCTWIYSFITNLIQPLTNLLLAQSDLKEIIADFLAIFIIIIISFFLGIIVKTKLGKLLYELIENNILYKIPGYSMIKETILQFLGDKKSPFSSVALVNIFGNDTMLTAFITDEHEDGTKTVFVPTGPNPTSGNIYHIKNEYVHPINVSIEDAMRSIISCGNGSKILIDKIK
jgi:uncharacterized membrane protein